MKKLLSNEYVIFLVRLVMGGLFIAASIDKILDPGAFEKSIVNYRIIFGMGAAVTATVLPWLELLCGMTLVVGILPRGSSFLILVMMIGFTLAVASALIRGLDITCGCFTQDPAAHKIGWQKIVENLLMTAGALFLFLSSGNRFSMEHFLRRRKITHSPLTTNH